MLKFVALAAFAVDSSFAYSSSLEDCEAFAAKWSGSCGGTDEDSVYTSGDWETSGAGATVSSCSTRQDKDGNDIEVMSPYSGDTVTSFSVFARNCVTCTQASNDDPVYIRFQSNNMPKYCFATPLSSSNYAQVGKFDVTMRWNPNVLNVKNVEESEVGSVSSTEALLCSDSFTDASNLPATSELTSDTSTSSTDKVVGWSIENVQIYSGVSSGKDALTALSSQMDFCLTYSQSDLLTQHSMSACVGDQASTSTVPYFCDDSNDDQCNVSPVVFAAKNFTSTDLPYETEMGIAKDGHIIVGPYNDDGELWSCDEHDVCNGVFLSDNSYAYAMTYTFPYVVGCWGPGPDQVHKVSCSKRSCSDEDSSLQGFSFAVATLLTAIAPLVWL